MKSLKLVGKSSPWQNFLLLGVLWLILVSIPTIFYSKEIGSQIAAIRYEQQGLKPAQLMLDIIQRTQQHRSLTARFLQEDPSLKNSALKKERRAKAEDLEEAIVDLEDYSRKIQNSKIEKTLDDITADWHQISQHVTVRDISAEQNFQLHESLIRKQLNALQMVIDSYQLSRDAESNGHFLITSSLVKLPQLVEVLAQLQTIGSTILVQGEANFSDRVELKSSLLFSKAKSTELDFEIYKAVAGNANAKDAIQKKYYETQQQYQKLSGLTQEEILSKATFSYAPDEFNTAFEHGIAAYYDFVRFSITQIDSIFKNRIELKNHVIDDFFMIIFVMTALVVFIYGYVVRKALRQ